MADEPTGNLDSKSTHEVLDVFDALNAAGRTVVIITHEHDVAARAKRIIRLVDGEIVEERLQSPIGSSAVGPVTDRGVTAARSVWARQGV